MGHIRRRVGSLLLGHSLGCARAVRRQIVFKTMPALSGGCQPELGPVSPLGAIYWGAGRRWW